MPNRQSAQEWLEIARHDLAAASLLYKNDHYTDTIGFLLQQSIEKMLKAILAFHDKRIRKSHDLVEIYSLVKDYLVIDNFELEYLEAATTYYVENRYPNAYQTLPSREEIKEILDFSYLLIKKINNLL